MGITVLNRLAEFGLWQKRISKLRKIRIEPQMYDQVNEWFNRCAVLQMYDPINE